ncbi:MAG: fluoride efflux transporter CrcB [Deltaproteobacteria bacterium]|nr:fluoride efflux transporter CrcB [Deltaproteobacteria bacterium]
MKTLVLISIAGGVGSAARYLVSLGAVRYLGQGFPYGTLIVNVLGSFVIAIVMHLGLRSDVLSPTARITLATGLMGGFTTYSAFNYETLDLVSRGSFRLAATNVLVTLVACIAAGLVGLGAARALLR